MSNARHLTKPESFDQAVADFKAALELKYTLYSAEASQISSAHYMLALALEFCTAPTSRTEAAREIQKAIDSFEMRIKNSTAEESSTKIKDEKEMLAELKAKLSELQEPPSTINKKDIADMFGTETTAVKESLVQAMQNSNDLSSLVRKKDKKRSLPDSNSESKPADEALPESSKKAKLEE